MCAHLKSNQESVVELIPNSYDLSGFLSLCICMA